MHPHVAMIRARIEATGSWDEANEDHIRHLESREEWFLFQKPNCDDDTRNDIRQLLELPERTPIDLMLATKIFTLDQAKMAYQIHKDYFNTHRDELC